ncbi:hypothetical protein AAD018_001445 [Aestuariibius insulae]|uniref:hypothetical protein n=1 Tax=Aestuariibius insulae TaxID=2058287 RepID=UPI00345EA809
MLRQVSKAFSTCAYGLFGINSVVQAEGIPAFQILDDTPYTYDTIGNLPDKGNIFTVIQNESLTQKNERYEFQNLGVRSPDVNGSDNSNSSLTNTTFIVESQLTDPNDSTAYKVDENIAREAEAQQPHDYFVVNQSLKDFISILAGSTSSRINVSENIRTKIFNSRVTGNLDEIMSWIEARHDVDCFEFNGTYYLSARSEAKTRVVHLGDMTAEDARASLTDAGLNDTDYALHITAGGSAVALSGPPRLLAVAETIIEAFPAAKDGPPGPKIRVRRGIELSLESILDPDS